MDIKTYEKSQKIREEIKELEIFLAAFKQPNPIRISGLAGMHMQKYSHKIRFVFTPEMAKPVENRIAELEKAFEEIKP